MSIKFKFSFFFFSLVTNSKNALVNDASVKTMIKEQTTQWTQMMERQRKEEWELSKTQLEGSKADIKACIPAVQAQQLKLLETRHAQ